MSIDLAAGSGLIGTIAAEASSDFDTIVKLYRPKIFRFLFASIRERETAENLTQDCFLKAYKAQSTFRNDCALGTWLMQIAVNVLRDHLKNRRLQFWRRVHHTAKPLDQELQGCLAGHQNSPEATALLNEQVAAVWDAAATLPEKQRTVFLLRFVQDMDLHDIALTTGMNPATIRTHLFRALSSVRRRLGVEL